MLVEKVKPAVVLIEGDAAVGKSEMAKILQSLLQKVGEKCLIFDTGKFYRAVAYAFYNQDQGVEIEDFMKQGEELITVALGMIGLSLNIISEKEDDVVVPKTKFYLGEQNLEGKVLYSGEIDDLSPGIAGNDAIQKWCNEKRLEAILGSEVDVVIITGRDLVLKGGFDQMGGLRIVLKDSIENRVKRRREQKARNGENKTDEAIRAALLKRDERDHASGVSVFGGNWVIERSQLSDCEAARIVFAALRQE